MSGTKKVWRGRAAYERLLAERDREGWSLPELSQRSGVPESTLQRWHRRLRRERELAPHPFVEIVAVQEPAPTERVEVVLRCGRTIVLPPCRPFRGLGELVTLLESC